MHFRSAILACGFILVAAATARAQSTDSTLVTVERIYTRGDFATEPFGPSQWIDGGTGYTTLEAPATGEGLDIVRYDTETGRRDVLIPAHSLTPAGQKAGLDIEDYWWSPDGRRLLIFTNSQRVWRDNTRGDYWVLNRDSGTLRRLGGDAPASTLMFAKFSPDGRRVGYVRQNDLYVEDVDGGAITRLTRDGSRTIINGTTDWVYEEELSLRDAWRWSPDGRLIAYWQFNADSVRDFLLVNYTDSIYSTLQPVQYPKVGASNSAVRVGVVPADGGGTRWIGVPGDPRNNYIARMGWAQGSNEVVIQQLNRLQNTDAVLLGDARTGAVRPVLVERDSAWVDVVDDLAWLDGGKRFTWISERDGWRHAYAVSRDGRDRKLLTKGSFDVISVQGIDPAGGWLYYAASPDNPAQRYLFRVRLDGSGKPERLTPANQPGWHTYNVSPDFRYALHTYSSFGTPPLTELVRLPEHQVVRTPRPNAQARGRVAALRRGPVEFFTVNMGSVALPAYLMKPPGYDPAKKYPVLFFVYGGPATQTVLDWWGGPDYLWHLSLTQQGYIVASVDNRGTPAPLGRAFRKAIYGHVGVVETQDQTAAARIIGRRADVDSLRMGVWGWSNGAFMTLNLLFRSPEVYRAGIAVAPVTNWKFYDDVYTERYNGLYSTNAKGYEEGSPINYVKGLRAPLLLVHGSGDDNVHFQNTEVLINALVAADKPFDFMEYPNRTHALLGGNSRRHLFELMTRFLRQNLPVEGPASQ